MPLQLLRVIVLLFHAWVGWRLLPALAPFPVAQALLAGVLAASALLMPLGLRAPRGVSPRLANALVWLGLLCMGLFSSLFVLTLVRDLVLLAAAALPVAGAEHAALRLWSALAVPALGLLATLWGFLNARRTAAVVRVDVPIAGLPAALHGFTVAQISDVHVGPTIRRDYLSRIVARVNSLNADMVAITGDLVDGKVPELAAHVAPLAQLASRHGSYFVTGNHEYYSGAPAWMAELQRLGVRVLLNEHVVLRHGGAPLVVAGVADFNAHHFEPSHRSDPQAALAGAPAQAGVVKLLLAHQPRSAEAAAEAGFDLQLSGHTHGGQFWPWNLLVPLQQPYTAGLHRLRALWIYTSRGTGYWGPPKRFGAPSEITHLRLVPAPQRRA
ncbi:metallophosphoesterase [Variovorax terrae]|uniref:Metallophosphoesterase n=1 Tax=Variovorax terrae TaxID=2923278 RepID=A0A9X1VZA9_9BURK|nr:metallophosphoesterase [Variovorax terrae]MCJ0765654.1 metallophosphoesterase [Variovorax terrae]